MESSNKRKRPAQAIGITSPLYSYWKSSQDEKEEEERLIKSSKNFPPAGLFRKEPYKWEMLYQSITREILAGDLNSIKGLKLLINMLNDEEQTKILEIFSNQKLFDEAIIAKLIEKEENNSPTEKNTSRFIRILFAIFTNPYCIEIKREKSHIYEYTGAACHSLRKFFQGRNKEN